MPPVLPLLAPILGCFVTSVTSASPAEPLTCKWDLSGTLPGVGIFGQKFEGAPKLVVLYR